MILFKCIVNNRIILCHNTSVKTQNPLNACKITASENVCLLVDVSMEANRVDADQTAV